MTPWLTLKSALLFGTFVMTSLTATAAQNTPPWDSMNLVGQGKLSVLFWDIYNAELYTADGTYQEAEFPIALRLVYLRDFKKKHLISETKKQWEKLGFKDKAKIATWISTLERLWRDVKEDESITLFIDKSACSYFYLNNEKLGQVDDPEFAQAFLDIWLSENTSAPDVRKKLIS